MEDKMIGMYTTDLGDADSSNYLVVASVLLSSLAIWVLTRIKELKHQLCRPLTASIGCLTGLISVSNVDQRIIFRMILI